MRRERTRHQAQGRGVTEIRDGAELCKASDIGLQTFTGGHAHAAGAVQSATCAASGWLNPHDPFGCQGFLTFNSVHRTLGSARDAQVQGSTSSPPQPPSLSASSASTASTCPSPLPLALSITLTLGAVSCTPSHTLTGTSLSHPLFSFG